MIFPQQGTSGMPGIVHSYTCGTKEGPAVWEAGPSTCGVRKARVASRNASNSGAPRAVPVTLTKKSDCDFAATKDGVS
jgi:hypothetical protein